MGQRAYWAQLETRLCDWIAKALRRRPAAEERVAAALRVAAPHSAKLLRALADAAAVLVDRAAYDRPLYAAAVRGLADAGHPRLPVLLGEALASEHGGGLPTLAASARCPSPLLDEPLARCASSRHPQLAFAAALVRRLRSDVKGGAQLLSAAARLKESARIDVCSELLAPLALAGNLALPRTAAPALRALRDAERHLGRWLVLARAGIACGDRTPLEEAAARARQGSPSAKASWALLGWALDPSQRVPAVRPTTEIVARLSDRPTADRDMSFLFRLADVRAASARGLLEQMSRPPLRAAIGVRAASALARGYGACEALSGVRALAEGKRRDLAGIAVAALWDGGAGDEARERAGALGGARQLHASVWGGLVLASDSASPVISEASYRHLEHGWIH